MVDLHPFYGRDNVEEFLDWEMKVDQIFESYHIEEERSVLGYAQLSKNNFVLVGIF